MCVASRIPLGSITHLYYCSRCEEGYYGDPTARQPCESCLCPDIQGSGRFFATSCHHEPRSLGLTCACREGHEGIGSGSCLRPLQGQEVAS